MLYEWGGFEDTGKTKNTFAKNRPNWAKPIHTLMVDNHVNIFFQGHDHLFAKEDVDGVVYQEVPIPCDSTYNIGYLANADAYTGVILDGAGYMKVTVSEPEVKVDYIKSYLPQDVSDSLTNGMLGYSYTVKSSINSIDEPQLQSENQTLSVSPNPAKDFIEIDSKDFNPDVIKNISIYNSLGDRVILIEDDFSCRIDISKLVAGPYTVIIKTTNGSISEKFIKIK